MILSFARDTLVVVENHVIDAVSAHAQTGRDAAEAGGILIGSYRGRHIDICECTVPMPADRRLRYMFDRLDTGHDRAAKEAWRKSQRTETYVGEWHTHPEDYPSPSGLDLRTWSNVMRHHREGPVLFLIVGRRGYWAGLGCRGTVLPTQYADAEKAEIHIACQTPSGTAPFVS
ncbi:MULTISPECIES: Mov34/MPN/PAD-1 family protein [unclassified Mesorhizobium]|uniref:Mov34/MPN/PAD-1 family protein n=1 Tax=unclassified Mesorhizobium TaxID=325217 RepID=UPI001673BC9D|nr:MULTISPECIES: Mov34/MPN/PAD-1 family protein [unclassified Mesorhizobium]